MKPKTIAWIGAGKDAQAHRDTIFAYAVKKGMYVDTFIRAKEPDEKPSDKVRFNDLAGKLNSGDTFIVSELSGVGKSILDVINTINRFIEMEVRFIAVKQDMVLTSQGDIISRTTISLLRLFSNLQKELAGERTRRGLAARKKAGIKLGRPKGSTSKSKLDPHKDEIATMLKHRAPLSYIARVYGVTWPTVENFIRSRKLDKKITRKITQPLQ